MSRSAECRCEHNFTCGYCLRNAKPYHFTPRTSAEALADAIAKPAKPKRPTRDEPTVNCALLDLLGRIERGEEFPDACWNVASHWNVVYEALADAYDRHCGFER